VILGFLLAPRISKSQNLQISKSAIPFLFLIAGWSDFGISFGAAYKQISKSPDLKISNFFFISDCRIK